MGNCLSTSDYITPRPSLLLPDPCGPSTFSASRNWFMSNNFNVYKGAEDNAALWLFVHVKGSPNGDNDSYFVLENFWRPPFSEEGDVICWCHLPAYQRNQAYQSSGYEEYGISPDLVSEVYWSDNQFADESSAVPMVHWKRKEWSFSVRLGFYRDRYMEEPLGVLDISSKGWLIRKTGGPGKSFIQPKKEARDVRYVFKDKHGLRFPIELEADLKGNVSFESGLFSCLVSREQGWAGDKRVIATSKAGYDPSLAFLVSFLCATVLAPDDIAANLRHSKL
ncbi:unnamed protein product [Calypogeia fissa]